MMQTPEENSLVPVPQNNGGMSVLERLNYMQSVVDRILSMEMPQYQAFITRTNPTAIVFLVDQSGSMAGGKLNLEGLNEGLNKSEVVAHLLNQTIYELLNKARQSYGLGNYMDIAIIGYGADSKKANFIWNDFLKGKTWVSMNELEENAQKKVRIIEEDVFGELEKQEQITFTWFDAVAENQTPMGDAIKKATELLKEWVNTHPNSYPPTVINLTDGEATDATHEELLTLAQELKQLATKDGKVLFFNCHITDSDENSVTFPFDISQLPDDEYAQLLFKMSSLLPSRYHKEIKGILRITENQPFVGMTYNTTPALIAKLLEVGTQRSLISVNQKPV